MVSAQIQKKGVDSDLNLLPRVSCSVVLTRSTKRRTVGVNSCSGSPLRSHSTFSPPPRIDSETADCYTSSGTRYPMETSDNFAEKHKEQEIVSRRQSGGSLLAVVVECEGRGKPLARSLQTRAECEVTREMSRRPAMAILP